MKRVVLTGARGFVGSACLAPLRAAGYEVHAVSRRPADGTGATWHQADLLDADEVRALLRLVRPTHLLHLAWEVTPGAFWTSPLNRRWVGASLDLLSAFGASGGRRAVLVGTGAEYGPTAGRCVAGETPIAPTTVYGACKAALSIMAPVFAAQAGIPSTAWARLFYLYGPREQPARLVPSVIRSLMDDEPIACTHGEQVRDILYVEDAAEALVALLDSGVTGAINVASGEPLTLRRLLCALGAELGRERLLQFGARPTTPDEPPVLVADVTPLAREVGWAPRTGLEAGLRRAAAWWRDEAAGGR